MDRSIHERRANQAIGWCRHRRQAGPAVGPWIVGLVLHEQPAGRRAGVRRRPPSPATSRSKHVSQRHPCRRISGRALTKLGKTGLPKELDEHLCAERVSQISVVGIDTDMCVLKTALDIFDLGIEPIILVDCCASRFGRGQRHLCARLFQGLAGLGHLDLLEVVGAEDGDSQSIQACLNGDRGLRKLRRRAAQFGEQAWPAVC